MTERTPAASTASALAARGLVRRHGGRVILDAVDLDVAPGERLAILGPNGAGKTTLLEVLAAVQPADGGSVTPGPEQLGWVPQRPALYERLTVSENLTLFAGLAIPGKQEAAEAAERALDFAELRQRAGQRLDRLSGGWRQRVSLAIGLLGDPTCVLLDEPHTALDPPQRLELWALIDRLAAAGTAVVITTHELHAAERHADRVIVLAGGKIVFSGTPDDLRARGGDHADLDLAFARVVGGEPSGETAGAAATASSTASTAPRTTDGAGA
ncbi:MAG: ABC transporter ATP-binding protein [Solirubrobacteraceae bacterium]|nr:ABC transporter ATP-binding protein [Solirubrobacteraceae bacterium]